MAHGLDMVRSGADVVDVGGESSRPGAEPVSEAEELRRVVPVIEALAPHVRVSVDTVKRGGGRGGRGRRRDARQRHLGLACGRWRRRPGWGGWPCTCRARRAPCSRPPLRRRRGRGARIPARPGPRRRSTAGVAEVWVDPGIGFGKTVGPQPGPAAPSPRTRGRGPARCWWGRAARRFLGRLAPGPDGRARGRWRIVCRAPSPPPPGPCWRGRPWSGSTTWPSRSRPPRWSGRAHTDLARSR